MIPERWRRIETLFHRAVELEPAARDALLDVECAGDPTLRAEVERLLASDTAGDDAYSRIEARAFAAPVDPRLGRRLGVYELVERLGAGGMGVVYRARRADGLFEHEVAIKLIRAENASAWTLRRFEFERRTLAALHHHGIARLLDGGTTDDGCPYLVMELVRGEPIDRYCARERLGVDARLRLFLEVCRAVHYAHQGLVVHCDLKPANVLIDERGVPRLLDFGIARLLEEEPARVPAPSPPTLARVATPEYASPEQLTGGPVTTAIDVYALGVVLYELLTGSRPFASDSRSPADWERLVREHAPERPSTRVARTLASTDVPDRAAAFRATSGALRRKLRGDLDRIVLMALRKEPERRYASVQALVDDLERHLASEPVRARDDSLAYRASKFVGRNRVAVAAAIAVVAALAVGLVAARRGERLAAAEARHARMEADSFQGIASFLMDAFLPAQPAQDQAWQERARRQVVAHAERVRRQHAENAHVRANLLDTLGQVAARLDLLDDAHALLREAAEIRARSFGERSIESTLSLRSLGQLAYQTGDYAEAADLLGRALEIQRAAGEHAHVDVAGIANDLAACLRNLGRDAEALALHEEALALRRADGEHSLQVAESLNNLAGVHQGADVPRAVAELREALAIRSEILGDEHPLTLQTLSNVATVLWRAGERDEARATLVRAQAGYRALGGDGEDGLGLALSNLAAMQLELADRDGARASLDEALALQTKRLGADHPLVAVTRAKLAVLHHSLHEDDRAREHWLEILRIRRANPESSRDLAEALYGYGVFLRDVGECKDAVLALDEALALQRAQADSDQVAQARCEYVLGLCAERDGRRDAAREHVRAALALFDAAASAPPGERERMQRRLDALDRPAPR